MTSPTVEDAARIILWNAVNHHPRSYSPRMISVIPSSTRTAALKLGQSRNWWMYSADESVFLNDNNTLVNNAALILSRFTDRAATVPVTDLDPAGLKLLTDTRLLVVVDGVARCGISWWTPKSPSAPGQTAAPAAPSAPAPAAPVQAPAKPVPYDQMDEGLHAPASHRPKAQAPSTVPNGHSQGLVAGVEMLAQLKRIAAALEDTAAATNPPTEVLGVGTSPVLDTARELAVLLAKGESATASILRRRVCAKRRELTTAALQYGVEQRAFTRTGSAAYGAEYVLTDPEALDLPWALIHSLSKKKKPLRALTA